MELGRDLWSLTISTSWIAISSGVSSVRGLGQMGSLCPFEGQSVPLQMCSEIRGSAAALGTKWQLCECCQTYRESGARTGCWGGSSERDMDFLDQRIAVQPRAASVHLHRDTYG